MWGEGRGWSRGQAKERFRWSARPLCGAVCRAHAAYPAFAPCSSEVAVGFLVFLYLVHNLPQLCMHIGTQLFLVIVSWYFVA